MQPPFWCFLNASINFIGLWQKYLKKTVYLANVAGFGLLEELHRTRELWNFCYGCLLKHAPADSSFVWRLASVVPSSEVPALSPRHKVLPVSLKME